MHGPVSRRVVLVTFAALACCPALAIAGGAAPVFSGNDSSYSPSVSADGRYVAFVSIASNLVPGDTNGVLDAFVLDRQTDTVVRASTNQYGGQADGQTWSPAISPDGRYLAFASNATNLVEGDTNGAGDVFRKDLVTGDIVRVSVGDDDSEATGFPGGNPRDDANVVSISAGGRFVAFQSCLAGLDGGGCGGILRDLVGGTTRRFSTQSYPRPAVGARDVAGGVEVTIAFTTPEALVPGDTGVCAPGQSTCQDVYLARSTVPASGPPGDFTYRLVSATAGGDGSNDTSGTDNIGRGVAISADGTRIAFVTEASDLSSGDANGELDAYYYVAGDTPATSTLTRETDGIAPLVGSLSFPSVAPALSADGTQMLYFDTGDPSDGDWIVRSVPGGANQSVGTGAPVPGTRLEEVGHGAVANGGSVAAWQTATFDLPGSRYDTRSDVFVHDDTSGSSVTTLASRGRLGTERDGHSRVGAISGDGTVVAFSTLSWDYGSAAGDTGANRDVYVRNLADTTTLRVSSLLTSSVPIEAYWPDLSHDGQRVVFVAGASSLDGCGFEFGRAWVATLGASPTVRCLDGDAPGFTGITAEPFPQPTISDDGGFAAFGGFDPSVGDRRLFIRDLANDTLERVPAVGAVRFEDGTIQLSGDGRYLVHAIDGPGRGAVAVYDRIDETDVVVSRVGGTGTISEASWGAISADGNFVAFVSPQNLTAETPAPPGEQVYVYERSTQVLTRLAGEAVGKSGGTAKARVRLSADGRYVAWIADDLCTFRCVSRLRDVVVHDRETSTQRIVSTTPSWGRPNGPSAPPDDDNGESAPYTLDFSAGGDKVVFASSATNLAPTDENAADDVYLVELGSQSIVRVSAGTSVPAGDTDRVAPQLSGDGDTLSYAVKDRDGAAASGTPGGRDAKRTDGTFNKWGDVAIQSSLLGEIVVSKSPTAQAANGDSGEPSISANGALVAYQTDATNLTTSADVNGTTDIVLFDANKAGNVAVSKTASGNDANGKSFDPSVATMIGGKWGVTYTTSATNLGADADTNGVPDIVLAVEGGEGGAPTTVRISVATDGTESNGPSAQSSLAADGTFATFASLGSNLAPGDTNGTTDVFMRNLVTNETALLSAAPGGAPANGPSSHAVGDKFGTAPNAPPIVAFETDASNLVANDLNGSTDVVAWTPALGTFVVSRGLNGVPANGTSTAPQVSRGGRYISFVSTANNLVADDTNGRPDVFVYDTTTQEISRISRGHLGQEPDDVTTSAAVAQRPGGQRVVAWDSAARNLRPTLDPDAAFDLYLTVDEAAPEPILMEGDLVFRNGYE